MIAGVATTELPGVLLLTPAVHGDARGFFLERYRTDALAEYGIGSFVQSNQSRSLRGVLRGLHWQVPPHAQGKLVSVARGEILDVAVDLRRHAPTFGRWTAASLDDREHRRMWVPPGFAHGFVVRSEVADVLYETTAPYAPEAERGLAWDDPQVAIDWRLAELGLEATPTLSERDRRWPALGGLDAADLFDGEDPA
jgi:dTDP-4-dehydrorhamnose 3,5-epimerase